MKLTSTTPIKWGCDQGEKPYFLKRCAFENEDVFDRVSDVNCIIEAYAGYNTITVHVIKPIYINDNAEIIPEDEIDVELKSKIMLQIEKLITNKLD